MECTFCSGQLVPLDDGDGRVQLFECQGCGKAVFQTVPCENIDELYIDHGGEG